MVVLRSTQKLRRSLPTTEHVTHESDTALGDWYVNRLVVDRRPLLLLMSSRGLLPLLISARDVSSLPARLPSMVASALRRLSIPEVLVVAEYNAMSPVVVAPTRDRSVLGVMVDAAMSIPYHLTPGQWNEETLPMVEYQLAHTPWFAKRQEERVTYAIKAVPHLLEERWRSL